MAEPQNEPLELSESGLQLLDWQREVLKGMSNTGLPLRVFARKTDPKRVHAEMQRLEANDTEE